MRDGSGVYHIPPGTEGEPDTTIESAKYNAYIADIEQDLNIPRPINAGGTGATSADAALAAISAEKSGQVITNYDSAAFVAGSFYSASSATSPPVAGHSFAGIVYRVDDNNLVVEARDLDDTAVPPRVYVRYKKAGVWSAWSADFDQAAQDARFVNVTGDTMTSTLQISMPVGGAQIRLTNTTDGGSRYLRAAAGSGLEIVNNAYTVVTHSFSDTGDFASSGPISAGYSTATTGTYYFGNNGTKSLTCDGANFFFNGGAVVSSNFFSTSTIHAQSDIYADNNVYVNYDTASGGGSLFFGSNGTRYLNHDGTNFSLIGGNFFIGGTVTTFAPNSGSNANFSLNDETVSQRGALYWNRSSNTIILQNNAIAGAPIALPPSGVVQLGLGMQCRQGTGGAYGSSAFNTNWTGSALQAWVDGTLLGTFNVTCDYRTKENERALPRTWDQVKALRPIEFNYRNFGDIFKGDSLRRWGFVAHELQQTLTESAATGYKDAPDIIQSPDMMTVIAALTRALQEAMTRIEELENRM